MNKQDPKIDIQYAEINNATALRDLHDLVSKHSGTLARSPGESPLEHFANVLEKSKVLGINIGAYHNDQLIGFVYCYKSELAVFKPTLANLTIAVHPDYQAKGIGRELLTRLINQAKQDDSTSRIELHSPSINLNAIKLYESVGFTKEGLLRKRVMLKGKITDDLIMACVF